MYLLILLLILISQSASKKYNNYTLYRGIPTKQDHITFFETLNKYGVNFWRPPGFLHKPVDFVVPPDKKKAFLREAALAGVYIKPLMEDVQYAFDMQTVKKYVRRNMDSFDWNSYFRYEDIYNWLRDLAKTYHDIMTLESIGNTLENREILAVNIIHKNSLRRSKVIVEGGIHAREWISVAFTTYFLHQILTAPSSNDKTLRKIAKTYEWYFIPVLNPDGYEYTHTTDRLFRKNKRLVDINRNFGIAFGTVGVSAENGSETYCGESAFSEAESIAMGNLVRLKNKDLEYYLAFHSYGQYIIIPYAFSSTHQENYEEVEKMGVLAAKEISKNYGTHYLVGTAFDTVGYLTSGVSGCWVKKSFDIPYVLTFELRDEGQYGFALPPKQILPTCKETMDGMKSILAPRKRKFEKLQKLKDIGKGGQINLFLDVFVVAWNIFLFVIVRFN